MPDTTDATPATAMIRPCVVCYVKLLGGVAVGLIESDSGPGRVLYACRGCVKYLSLLPLDEQETPVGDGRLQFRADPTTP